MKGDYSLLDIIRHELNKNEVRSHLVQDEGGWHLDAGIVKVLVQDEKPKYFVCDTDFAAFYITTSCMVVVDEVMRVLSK
jgi:hypothetical protein